MVMVRYVLDTDHISLLFRNNPLVSRRFKLEVRLVGIAVISVQESFHGWTGKLSKADGEAQKILNYGKLHSNVCFFQTMPILNYDQAASDVYQRLIQANADLGKKRLDKDVRIAAIAISLGATIVTRNRKDFELVPGLVIEDWSQ
jgi:tRNA(fMet)-specific endonuclease VapC